MHCGTTIDISKAFDRVWHCGLIFKLKCIEIEGPLLSWFEDYLSGRPKKVVLCGQESTVLGTNAGVPQGSILGPLLFLIFINDNENNIRSDMFIFADDTTLANVYNTPLDAESCLKSDVELISAWAKKWMVIFNEKKTVYIDFSIKSKTSPPRSFLTITSFSKNMSINTLVLLFLRTYGGMLFFNV